MSSAFEKENPNYPPPFNQPLYKIAEVAVLLRISLKDALAIFRDEPGILNLDKRGKRRRKSEPDLRIPHAVLLRVWNELTAGGEKAETFAPAHQEKVMMRNVDVATASAGHPQPLPASVLRKTVTYTVDGQQPSTVIDTGNVFHDLEDLIRAYDVLAASRSGKLHLFLFQVTLDDVPTEKARVIIEILKRLDRERTTPMDIARALHPIAETAEKNRVVQHVYSFNKRYGHHGITLRSSKATTDYLLQNNLTHCLVVYEHEDPRYEGFPIGTNSKSILNKSDNSKPIQN